MAKLKMNFRGESNGLHRMAQEIMPQPRESVAAQRCPSEASNRIQQGCSISAETFGNGASTLTKAVAAKRVAIGVCCAAAHGRRATVLRCNPPTAMSSI